MIERAIGLYQRASEDAERAGDVLAAANRARDAADLGDDSMREMAIRLYQRLSEDKKIDSCTKVKYILNLIALKKQDLVIQNADSIFDGLNHS